MYKFWTGVLLGAVVSGLTVAGFTTGCSPCFIIPSMVVLIGFVIFIFKATVNWDK
jgi:hypothetical protein